MGDDIREDKFFATVFLWSVLLLVGMLFTAVSMRSAAPGTPGGTTISRL